jgi:hypothetical protein
MHLLDSELIAKLLSPKRASSIRISNAGGGSEVVARFTLVEIGMKREGFHAEPKTDYLQGTHKVSVTFTLYRAISFAILSIGRGTLAEASYQ